MLQRYQGNPVRILALLTLLRYAILHIMYIGAAHWLSATCCSWVQQFQLPDLAEAFLSTTCPLTLCNAAQNSS